MTAQIAHRAVALTAVGFLLVHILLETVSARAALLAAVLPFTDARGRLYLGLGTIASDLVIAVMATSLARMRYARSRSPAAVAGRAPLHLCGLAAGHSARHAHAGRPRVGRLDLRDLRGPGGRGPDGPDPAAGPAVPHRKQPARVPAPVPAPAPARVLAPALGAGTQAHRRE